MQAAPGFPVSDELYIKVLDGRGDGIQDPCAVETPYRQNIDHYGTWQELQNPYEHKDCNTRADKRLRGRTPDDRRLPPVFVGEHIIIGLNDPVVIINLIRILHQPKDGFDPMGASIPDQRGGVKVRELPRLNRV